MAPLGGGPALAFIVTRDIARYIARDLVGGDAVVFVEPAPEVDIGATLGAKRLATRQRRLAAGGAFAAFQRHHIGCFIGLFRHHGSPSIPLPGHDIALAVGQSLIRRQPDGKPEPFLGLLERRRRRAFQGFDDSIPPLGTIIPTLRFGTRTFCRVC